MAPTQPFSKKLFVALALTVFAPRMLLVLARYYLFRRNLGQNNALLDVTDVMRGWRGLIGMLARRKVLGVILGPAFGKHVTVYNTLFSKYAIRVGDNTYIGFDCNLGNVSIGSNVLISDGVTIMSGGHQHGTAGDRDYRYQEGEYTRVFIGDGAWIGAGAIVMTSVGAGAIVGAGSVVTKPVPDGHVFVGVPARPVKNHVE